MPIRAAPRLKTGEICAREEISVRTDLRTSAHGEVCAHRPAGELFFLAARGTYTCEWAPCARKLHFFFFLSCGGTCTHGWAPCARELQFFSLPHRWAPCARRLQFFFFFFIMPEWDAREGQVRVDGSHVCGCTPARREQVFFFFLCSSGGSCAWVGPLLAGCKPLRASAPLCDARGCSPCAWRPSFFFRLCLLASVAPSPCMPAGEHRGYMLERF